MRLPSKVTPYKSSTLKKFPLVLEKLQECDLPPNELYKKVKGGGLKLAEFIEILDCLFVLGKIELIPDKEVIHYVEETPM
jgi:hypothetical protein